MEQGLAAKFSLCMLGKDVLKMVSQPKDTLFVGHVIGVFKQILAAPLTTTASHYVLILTEREPRYVGHIHEHLVPEEHPDTINSRKDSADLSSRLAAFYPVR